VLALKGAAIPFLVERRPSLIVGNHDNRVSTRHATESTWPHDSWALLKNPPRRR
jgi:hypothetical protein